MGHNFPGVNTGDLFRAGFMFQQEMSHVPHYRIAPGDSSVKYFPSLKNDLDFFNV